MWSIIIITWGGGGGGRRGASVLPTIAYTNAQPERGFFCTLFALFLPTWGHAVNFEISSKLAYRTISNLTEDMIVAEVIEIKTIAN